MAEKMSWEKLLSGNRLLDKRKIDQGGTRTGFHRDYDRIAFSHPFRRMSDKTQVHPLSPNDHIHSRLTHSLEVSIVGRSLGMSVGEHLPLPDGINPTHIGQILQAACLMHDLGNPPFGHAGEDAIQLWFSDPKNAHHLEGLTPEQISDFQSFEGNAQAFRIVSNLENNPGNGGMQLTCATLGALMKYPWTSDKIRGKKKFGAFQAEKYLMEMVAKETGMIKEEDGRYKRHPLAYLAEAADDICYRIIDLEDAEEIGVVSHSKVKSLLSDICGKKPDSKVSKRKQISSLRSASINKAVNAVSAAFLEHEEQFLSGEIPYDVELISLCPPDLKEALDRAKRYAKKHIYTDPRKMGLQLGGYKHIGNMLELFCTAARQRIDHKYISYHCEQVITLLKSDAPKYGDDLYPALLKLTDFISGMTDHYASRLARQLSGMG
ncbi:deoxyguanosinetriphosphate triphosphohydrolase [Pontiella agarivorans]|uniref:Deoxyguanosinetriphosphate triphosphohydrolase n=1 Tax=Pontiella agarivorans TaxID=3038953 RepID=A0ABU5N161_9BACT|nr:deoxyguanosinetriphosphate triphosphohydrolase [Pontiella agarivorans]MDZ8120190.1 deoxyguanosinetriphosphate triphosphohydrolase [Pontiella agarivorans]